MKWILVLIFTLVWLDQNRGVKNRDCDHETKVDRAIEDIELNQQDTNSGEVKHLSTKDIAPGAQAISSEAKNKGETEKIINLNKRSFGENSTKGAKGEMGEMGTPGINGTPGLNGQNGQNGQKGSQGLKGPEGQKGVEGIMGQKGDRGMVGPMGHAGIKGDKGSIGVKGDMGLPGTPANTTDLEIKQEQAVREATVSSVSLSYASIALSILTVAVLLCFLCFKMRKIYAKLKSFCLSSRKPMAEFELPPPLPPPYIPEPDEQVLEPKFTDVISLETNSCYQTVTTTS